MRIMLSVTIIMASLTGTAVNAGPADEMLGEIKLLGRPPSEHRFANEQEYFAVMAARVRQCITVIAEFESAHPDHSELKSVLWQGIQMHAMLASMPDGGEPARKRLKAEAGRIATKYPGSSLADEAAFYAVLADTYYSHPQNVAAVQTLLDFAEQNAGSDFAPAAMRVASQITEELGDVQKQLLVAQKYVSNYPERAQSDGMQTLLQHLQRIGQPFELAFTALNGNEVNLQKMKDQVVVVYFWASWCAPCEVDRADLLALYEQYHSKGLEIIGISLDHEKEAMQSFLKTHQVTWPQCFSGDAWLDPTVQEWGIQAIPTTFAVDKRGFLRSVAAKQRLDKLIPIMLDEPGVE